MTTTNPRRQCERLWAANKYLVLSHSNKLYLEIRNYLKNEEVSLDQVQAYIDQALDLPEILVRSSMPSNISGGILRRKQPLAKRKSLWPNWIATQQAKFLSIVWWNPSRSSLASILIAIWRSQP